VVWTIVDASSTFELENVPVSALVAFVVLSPKELSTDWADSATLAFLFPSHVDLKMLPRLVLAERARHGDCGCRENSRSKATN
jgi:hypothetical protein